MLKIRQHIFKFMSTPLEILDRKIFQVNFSACKTKRRKINSPIFGNRRDITRDRFLTGSTSSKIIVILGPTASGKSELAVKIAKRFNGEIISADSRQVYKELNIGSGKITKKEMRGILHHLLDIVSPKKIFTVTQYQKLAKKALKDIIKRGKIPIICGGTGLYIDSLIYGQKFPEVPPQPKLRTRLEKKTTEELFEQLKKIDPKRAKNIDRYNRRRLIRAIEIILITKKPVPSKNTIAYDSAPYDILKIGINVPKEKLKARINQRVDKMIKLGLIHETKQLLKKYPAELPVFDAIGYREIIDYLKGKATLSEATTLIKKNTWQYAKRQITWFKRDKNIYWITEDKEATNLVKDFIGNLKGDNLL